MLQRIEILVRRLRRYCSSSHLLVKLLGLSSHEPTDSNKGLVVIQTDALGRDQLEKVLAAGKMPFLKNLLEKQHYRLHTHYSGMPCTTADVQAELFYGVKSAVPAFTFYDHECGRVFVMFNPRDAAIIEQRLKKQGPGLFEKGTAYVDMYTGGAKEAHFCISDLSLRAIAEKRDPLILLLVLLHPFSVLRILALLAVEFFLAIADCGRGFFSGRDLGKELKFVPSRVGVCVGLREISVIAAKLDIARGISIIHVNLMAYHEQSHRRGPTSRFAHWSLRGMDGAIRRLWEAAARSDAREYEVWVYSDHGQIETVPYVKKFGKTIRQAVGDAFESTVLPAGWEHKHKTGFFARLGLRSARYFEKKFPSIEHEDPAAPLVTVLGPMAHVYFKQKPADERLRIFIDNIINGQHVPLVIGPNINGVVTMYTADGEFTIPEQAGRIFDTNVSFYNEMVADFLSSRAHPDSGDLIIAGWQGADKDYYTYVVESGSHGGLASIEAAGYAILPKETIDPEKGYLRPMDLRTCILEHLGRKGAGVPPAVTGAPGRVETIRVMTYNVHSCVGMDGRLSPARIAEAISQYEPDIVCLQELDVGRNRSGGHDQAMLIAAALNMDHHFHPAMQVADEAFGDAILSRLPMRLVKAAPLSISPKTPSLEPRGALWVEIDLGGLNCQVLNTHLGLSGNERLRHARELLGDDWLNNPQCSRPVIFCGDLNVLPGSAVFKLFDHKLPSVTKKSGRLSHSRTWGGRYPFFCLDYIFVSDELKVKTIEIADSYLARVASDHRPLIADLAIYDRYGGRPTQRQFGATGAQR